MRRPTLTPSNTCFLGLTSVSTPNSISIRSAIFAYIAEKSPNAFEWGGQPQKLSVFLGGLGPHLIMAWAHPSQPLPNGISIGFLLVSRTWPTVRHTDQQTYWQAYWHYSVRSNRPLSLVIAAMRPKTQCMSVKSEQLSAFERSCHKLPAGSLFA